MTNIAQEYQKVNAAYNDWMQKANRAHDTVHRHQIDIDSLNDKTGIARVQLDQIALACINNKSNITKAAHTINTIVFDIRQTATAYMYDPDLDQESFTFKDGSALSRVHNQWY